MLESPEALIILLANLMIQCMLIDNLNLAELVSSQVSRCPKVCGNRQLSTHLQSGCLPVYEENNLVQVARFGWDGEILFRVTKAR